MRKIIMLVLGAITVGLGIIEAAVGGELKLIGAVGALAILFSFAFFEWKADLNRILKGMAQLDKWKDPAFWTALVASVFVFAAGELGLSVEIVNTVSLIIAALVPIILKMFRKEAPVPGV